MEKQLIFLITLGLLILTQSTFADGDIFFGKVDQVIAPHLQVIVNNHLVKQVNVEFQPHSYNDIWDGQCKDFVYPTQNKMICAENAGLSNGIPALFPLAVAHQEGSDPYALYLHDSKNRIHWLVTPSFDGDIFIKTLSGETLAKISYAMKAHLATLGTAIKHYFSYDLGEYVMWDDFKKDPSIDAVANANIRLSSSYPTGYNWCYHSESEYYGHFGNSEDYYQYNVANKLNNDPSKMPCSAVLTVDVSEKI